MNLIKRILVSLIFNSVAYVIFWCVIFFFAGGGHGSRVPIAIFWGWPVLLMRLYGRLFPLGSKLDGKLFYLIPALQMVLFASLWVRYARLKRYDSRYFLPVIHFIGAVVVLIVKGRDICSTQALIVSYFVAVVLIIFYWAGYYLLLKRA
jgi:hypothetical protein